jgi:hypothetical protein
VHSLNSFLSSSHFLRRSPAVEGTGGGLGLGAAGPTRSKAWYRSQILKEIIDTERMYINSIDSLNKLFIQPLFEDPGKRKGAKIGLTRLQVATIIPGDLASIITIHNKILSRLELGPQPDLTNDAASDASYKYFLTVFHEYISKVKSSLNFITSQCDPLILTFAFFFVV